MSAAEGSSPSSKKGATPAERGRSVSAPGSSSAARINSMRGCGVRRPRGTCPGRAAAAGAHAAPLLNPRLDWIRKSSEQVAGGVTTQEVKATVDKLRADGSEAIAHVSKAMFDSYVETDEDVGPRVGAFAVREKQPWTQPRRRELHV